MAEPGLKAALRHPIARGSIIRIFHRRPNQMDGRAVVVQVCDLPYRRLAVGSVRSTQPAFAGCKPAIPQTRGPRYAFVERNDYAIGGLEQISPRLVGNAPSARELRNLD